MQLLKWDCRYDLRHFLRWHQGVTDAPFAPDRLAEYDLIAYRQQMIAAGRRPATINRRLEALRRLGRWAHSTGVLAADIVRNIRPVRTVRNRLPAALSAEIRTGTIDRIMEMSDLELGLKALLGQLPRRS